ncbi:hypothetical protein ACSV9I_03700 [Rhizobium sp. G187]|uniref:hypothetical protein n=1 Tax=unclassified Rhizobium TaxID=2613769 RepID=UPI0006BA0ADD|nr:hypothetical protein [Rhizobium sp. AAP43]KPF44051.1 hypothetical protein IP76_11580 [Rhizobium sp. AAP43]
MATNDFSLDADRPQDNAGARSPSAGLHPLHEAAFRLADLGIRQKRSKTKDLIASLLCHGARAWRYSQPDTHIHLHVPAQSGRIPVILRLR